MKSKRDLTKEELEKREKRKLAGIYRKLDKDAKKSVESLIEEAAFMAASLYELRGIINRKGYTEEYQNGANQRGVKKCSEVEIYNTMVKNYMSTIKQLTDLLPKEVAKEVEKNDGFEAFVIGRKD
ncbi:hypothetical protein B5G11_12520 [Drancourtella sp. An57]|uniref:hypothetical protein n=1 Tax=Drancourtella sp. An57 TaxID=1965647 RepID=UPI000B3804A3|nr:hypothetical protein [Drancourtella sp. An57]OUN68584.1 hypothetical protein B5G11_12520 [Drancourtella sp. An57]